jgi:hypothetical protein
MTLASDTKVPMLSREFVALACSRVRSMGEEVPHSTDSSERLSDNPGTSTSTVPFRSDDNLSTRIV